MGMCLYAREKNRVWLRARVCKRKRERMCVCETETDRKREIEEAIRQIRSEVFGI